MVSGMRRRTSRGRCRSSLPSIFWGIDARVRTWMIATASERRMQMWSRVQDSCARLPPFCRANTTLLDTHDHEAAVKPTDIRIKDVSFAFEDHRYRTPIKFGGVAVDRVTLLNVDCVVETRKGRTKRGFGSMPLGNVWSFPSR